MAYRALLADIGGTNTRVALADGGDLIAGSVRRYRNSEFTALEPVLRQYLDDMGSARPDAACLAMAGPVRNGVGQLTNLDWTLNTALLSEATGADNVALLNDLQAQGYAMGALPDHAVQPVLRGACAEPGATKLVVGVGTGFNAAPVFDTPEGRFVPPAEVGHMLLPVKDDATLSLAEFIKGRTGFASVEDALSGRGLGTVHAWIVHRDRQGEALASAAILKAFQAGDPQAKQAVDVFCSYLGTVLGDLALAQLPFGGIYLIGGMSRAMAPYLLAHGFFNGFCDKGRFSEFMGQFPVSIVTDDDAALIGSAKYLMQNTAF